MKKEIGLLLLAALLVTTAGCRNAQRRPNTAAPVVAPATMPFAPGRPAAPPGFAPAPFSTVQPGQPAPNTAIPTAPPADSQPMIPPPAPPPTSSNIAPSNPIAQVENRWTPAQTPIQLSPPVPIVSEDKKESPRLYPPEKTPEPPVVKSTTTLPVGIPQFATAQDNVATGLRPSLDDGLDWLQARGYRTVVHIRLPGENDSADRKQVEKRGMKYVVLEVAPQTLNKMIVDEFTRLVRDTSGQPVFLYDRDGSLAGGLWYLHFRTAEQLPDDVARIRAGALGLRENRDGGHREMWLAVQKYLSENNP